jgi:hypothetical protein
MKLERRAFLRKLVALPACAALRGADPISFSCEIKRVKTGLTVTYAIRNDSAGDIGLFNRIPTIENYRETGFRPENTYIDFQGSSLLLRKMALPLPSGVRMTVRPVPYVTRVGNGQTYREEMTFSEPISVDDPMRRASIAAASPGRVVKATRRREAASIIFSLGYFRGDPGVRFDAVSPQYPDIYRVWPPGPPVDRQQILTKTVSLSPPVTVMDYE